MNHRHWNFGLGVLFVAFSTVTLSWWIPNDVKSGILVQQRHSIEIGDAMAPTVVSIGIFLISLILIILSIFGRSTGNKDPKESLIGLTKSNLINALVMALLIGTGLTIMVWAGPLSVDGLNALGFNIKPYRTLVDTVPYKYIGFASGGFLLVFSLISWVEGRASLKAGLTAIAAVVVLIVLYDVPFDTLLLPPNGSQ